MTLVQHSQFIYAVRSYPDCSVETQVRASGIKYALMYENILRNGLVNLDRRQRLALHFVEVRKPPQG